MTKKESKLGALNDEIRLIKANLRILGTTKKTRTCRREPPHYHALLHYDNESGDEYEETSRANHIKFLAKLKRQLAQLEDRAQRANVSGR